MPRLTPVPTLAAFGLIGLFLLPSALRAAEPIEQESRSGEYVARVTATEKSDGPGVAYPLTIAITTRSTKRTVVFPTEVSAVTKWIARWDPKVDCFIFFAPQAEGWSAAYVPESKYGPFISRPLTDDEKAFGEKMLDEKYGTRKPERRLPIPR